MFAPKSRLDVLSKFVLFCSLIVSWNIIWSWQVSGQQERELSMLILDALAVGGPFAALFTIGSWHQVTAIQSLYWRARIDPLSGVLNRQAFMGRIEREIANCDTGMLLLLDADHFKDINDEFGHAAGDLCIQAIGQRLLWHLRDEDTAGRIGGEEFAVLLPNVSKGHGRVVASRIGQPVSFKDVERLKYLSVTMSIGAVWFSRECSAKKLLLLADQALYRAKTTGRARIVISGEDHSIPLGRAKSKARSDMRRQSRTVSAS